MINPKTRNAKQRTNTMLKTTIAKKDNATHVNNNPQKQKVNK